MDWCGCKGHGRGQLDDDDRFKTCLTGINKSKVIIVCTMFKTDEVRDAVTAAKRFQKDVVRKWDPYVDEVLKNNYMTRFSDCEGELSGPTGALILDLCQKL